MNFFSDGSLLGPVWRFFIAACVPLSFKSSSSASATTDNSVTSIDKRLVTDANSIGVSADNSSVAITTSDMGAITAAFDFAKNGFQALTGQMKENNAVIGDTIEFAKTTTQLAQDQKDALTGTRQLAVVGMIIGGIAAAAALSGKIK